MKRLALTLFLLFTVMFISACSFTDPVYKTVKFDVDGNITEVKVEIKSKIEKPEDPVKDGYVFKGWYKGEEEFDFETKILKDITLVAKFEEDSSTPTRTYTVIFKDYDGTVLKEEEVIKGGSATAPQDPNREGYEFVGWSKDFSNVTDNIIVIAKYEETLAIPNIYKVIFKDYDGRVIREELVEEGTGATAPPNPTREGYTFKCWDKDFSNITNGLTVTAVYDKNEETPVMFNVIFKDYDGRTIKTEAVEKGKSATAPTNPSREGYTFKGWDKAFDNITSDLSVTATYDRITFTVTFKDYNGTILKQETVNYNENATAPANPSRTGYTFTGWDKDYTKVKSNLEVTATYQENSADTTYAIVYNLGDGTWEALNKSEYIKLFLIDFYNFVNPTESLNEFMYDSDNNYKGTWNNYLGGYFPDGVNKLLKNNDFSLDDDAYFLNSKQYKERWSALANWVKTMNKRFGDQKEADYYGGSVDFYRYCIDDSQGYASIYGDMFNNYPSEVTVSLNSYKKSNTDIVLPTPYRSDFLGWYLNSDYSGDAVSKIKANTTGALTLYAKWDTVGTATYEISFNVNGGIKLDSITVDAGQRIVLPRTTKGGYLFKGWTLNGNVYNKGDEYIPSASVTFKAVWADNLQNLVYSGNNVTYRNSTTVVQIPVTYESKVNEFRGAWVTSLVGDFSASSNKSTMMANLTAVLDLLESYNMNAVVFHIRMMNDACYDTDLAPIRNGYGDRSTFASWDYLTWFISECHKRGIEFHAWLNPYRISSNGYSLDDTTATVASKYTSYPKNPASKAENILMTYSSGKAGAILNPCKEEVQDYIVDVCLEVMEKYDVDAIHFDDYFYAQLSSNNDFLNEADKVDYEAYIDANPTCGYSKTSKANKQQWRRDNVDNFIYKLHTAMTEFNASHHRCVQLGIAPTGIYKNGNGIVTYNSDGSITTTGSNTNGQTHYSSYLFCDTVKWIRNEWIDYICPQSYWAFTHSSAGYADVVDWWDKVVEGTHVNLYTGMGIYMSTDYSSTSWASEAYEASNQVLYNTKFNNVKGTCIYVYNRIKRIQNNEDLIAHAGLMRIKNEYWTEYVSPPETMASKYKG